MKKLALFYAVIGSVCSYSCFAQSNIKNQSDLASNDLAVVSYHVEERINRPMGSSITTYDVSNLSLVHTNDLGQNNTRVVTPKYGRSNAKVEAVALLETPKKEIPKAAITTSVAPIKSVLIPVKKKESVSIDVVGTYERVMDKGYKSADMLVKVADRHFFEGDMALAAKWYTELFNVKTDFEAVYYYRYAKSLIDTGQTEKGNEMMKIFETKSL